MDPTVAVAAIGAAGALAIAIVNGRTNAERINDKALIGRLKKRLIDKHKEDPDEVDDI